MASALNISPEILHRVASLACGGLDTLPHNGAVTVSYTHLDVYKRQGLLLKHKINKYNKKQKNEH